MGRVWRAELEDGRHVILKQTGGYPADLEAEGLRALADAGGPVPQVVACDGNVLVLTDVSGAPAWEALGRGLAAVHQRTAEAYGWHRDNVIGPLPQANDWDPDWPTFFVERRLVPYLADLPTALAKRLERLCAGPLPDLLEHGQPPSLVHGDLWAGNIVDGRALIDPAVHYADRELDFAMLALFGGVPAPLQAGYEAVWPLDPGHGRRRPALQLYHLLVHVRLFGAGYLASVAARLDEVEADLR